MEDLADKAKSWLDKGKKWVDEHPKLAVGILTLGLPVALLCIGGYIVTTALIYAVLSVSALGVLIYKMRHVNNVLVRRAYNAIVTHKLATDIGFTGLVYVMSPGGIIGILGASISACLASGILAFANPIGETEHVKADKDARRKGLARSEDCVELPKGSYKVRTRTSRRRLAVSQS